MNVYKVIDTKTPYSGGMALIAADNEEDAIDVIVVYSSNYHASERDIFEATILKNIFCDTDEPYLITEDWYYE